MILLGFVVHVVPELY